MVSTHRCIAPARELLLMPVAGPSKPRYSSTAIAASGSPTSAAARRHKALAQLRDSNAYVARYRTLGPSSSPLLSSTPSVAEVKDVGASITRASSIRSSSSSSHSPSDSSPASTAESSQSLSATGQIDETWAFGGGARSQGGPAPPKAESSSATAKASLATPSVVMGNAGKGAIANYGKRKSNAVNISGHAQQSGSDQKAAQKYEHKYSPSTRTEQPLPQHTYFSSPSSSFNASSFVAPGTQPPLRGAATAGVGEGHSGIGMVRKKAALIFPGQGSQYVAMSKDLYKRFRSARSIWHQAEEALMSTPGHNSHHFIQGDRAKSLEQREMFEAELAKTRHLDSKSGLLASGTAVARSRRGWLRDLVFAGDQLELTRAENAQPAILACTLAFLQVLRKDFSLDLIKDHVQWAAGHGSGVYAALVGSGAVDLHDAVRLLRHRGLTASEYTANNPVLFPPGCKKPDSIYETWAFANAGSGKGAELADEIALGSTQAADSGPEAVKSHRGWKRTQMSGVVVKPGKLQAVLNEVKQVAQDIRDGKVSGVATDEVVEAANVNSQLQIVLSGSRVGVSYCCDRLRSKNLGARAVNLPVSGPYHTSLMSEASAFLRPAVKYLPISDPQGFSLVSSITGNVLPYGESIRNDLSGASAKPVAWLSSIDTLIEQGVERFICLGPGRACAHLLSKELAYRDRKCLAQGLELNSAYEVWSLATVEDVEQLAESLVNLSHQDGIPHTEPMFDADRLTAD